MKKLHSMVLKNSDQLNAIGMHVLDLQIEDFPVGDSLEYLQTKVGGYIEHVIIDEKLELNDIDMWINEEGKLIGMRPTMLIYHDEKLVDAIVGDCVFTKHDEEGNTIGLTDTDVYMVGSWIQSLQLHVVDLGNDEKQIVFIVHI